MKTENPFLQEQLSALFPEEPKLRAEIARTRRSMEAARNRFEQAVDPTLIDCYIYELNAAQLRYQFLLGRYKRLETLEAQAMEQGKASSGAYFFKHIRRTCKV